MVKGMSNIHEHNKLLKKIKNLKVIVLLLFHVVLGCIKYALGL